MKSGADFPQYIRDIKKLGVTHYDAYVTDGHNDYYGANDFKTSSSGRYSPLMVAEAANVVQFKQDIAAHQQGKTDYMTFCNDCARSGVKKWTVNLVNMTCIYYD